MKKLARVIVGIDIFSESDAVLKRGFRVAKESGAKLFIVQAVEMPWFSVPDYFSNKEIKVDTKGISERIELKIKSSGIGEGVPYSIFVKEGNPDDVILYESKLLKAELIVIGAHTKSKSKKKMLGTTAQKVAHQSHLPVLIVKNSAEKPYKTILAATDFEMQSKQSVLFAKNIFPSAKIKAVNAYEAFYITGVYTAGVYTLDTLDIDGYDKAAKVTAKNSMKAFVKEVGIEKSKIIEGEPNSKEALHEYIEKGNYDLVVVGSRGTSGVMALLGSIALFLIKDAPTDILVYVP